MNCKEEVKNLELFYNIRNEKFIKKSRVSYTNSTFGSLPALHSLHNP